MLSRRAGCDQTRMPPIRHFSQLIVWKLAEDIRSQGIRADRQAVFAADFKAKRQARMPPIQSVEISRRALGVSLTPSSLDSSRSPADRLTRCTSCCTARS